MEGEKLEIVTVLKLLFDEDEIDLIRNHIKDTH